MAVISWNGASNLDLKILGQTFDFRTDVLQISDPSLQANQFDLVENGTDLAIVKSRDATGAELPAADKTYAYIPNMLVRQVGGTDASPVSSNIVLSNGGQLWVGDRLTDTLLDDAGNDATALGTQLQSVQVWGLGGADTITTGDGNDRVYGNTGADVINGGAGNDSLYGGQENDTVSGGAGNDLIAGDLGNDQLNGGAGNDIMYGGAGNDVLDPDTGNDTLFAGNGNDTVSIGNSDTGDKLIYMDKMADLVNIISTTGNHLVYLGENNDIAYLEANSGNVQVFGDSGNDSIVAQNFGSDTLNGGADDDILRILNGSIGQKSLIGGDGDDSIYIEDSSGTAASQILPNTQVTVSAGEGDDVITYTRGLFITDANDGGANDSKGGDILNINGQTVGGPGGMPLVLRDLSIQNIETVNFNYSGGNAVTFADGNNIKVVNGASGGDYLDASRETSAAYTLNGQGGADTLIGGAGADSIVGGAGEDLMTGNGGEDTFRWNDTTEGNDTISDFNPDIDKLSFHGTKFGGISDLIEFVGVETGKNDEVISINTNLFVATGKGYTTFNDFYSEFVRDTIVGKDSKNPGFYVFYNTVSKAGELWYDPNMNKNNTGDETLIVTFSNVSASNQLARIGDDDFLFPTL